MIGKAKPGKGFRGLQDYLLENDRAAWTSTRNLFVPDLEYVPAMMRETAKQSDRVEKPVYHLSLALARGESLSQEQWEAVAERVLGKLGLGEHQALLVLHQDKGHEHLHLMINRVHPEHARAWSTWKDWVIRERELRAIEKDLGLTQVHGPGFLLEKGERLDRTKALTSGERQEKDRSGEPAFVEQIRAKTAHHFREAQSWAELSARLHAFGLKLEARGRGLVVTDGERLVKASRISRQSSRPALERRLGPFAEWAKDATQIREALEREQLRASLDPRWQKTVRLAERLDDRGRRLEALRDQEAVSEYKLDALLKKVYRGTDAAEASERLQRAAWVAKTDVADRLAREPERFGRVRGEQIGPFRTPARAEAREAAAEAGRELIRLQELRNQLRKLAPFEAKDKSRAAKLRQHAAQLAWTRQALPAAEDSLLALGRLVERHGEQDIRDLLRPVLMTLRLARAAYRGTLGQTVADYAVGKLLGPAAAPLAILERAVGMVRRAAREPERGRGWER